MLETLSSLKMAETKDDEARHERKAKRPWPAKAELSKRAVTLTDTEGRKYYKIDIRLDSERDEYIKDFMSGFNRDSQAYWIALPAKTTLGGMPEQSMDVKFKDGKKMRVLGASEMTERKQRGTGIIVFAPVPLR